MIVCPVCEHQQETGAECELCGRRLADGAAQAAEAVAPIEGLEPTRLDAAAEDDASGGLLPELETTHHQAVELPLLQEVVDDLEPTMTEPVEVAPDVTPDLEREQAGLPDDPPTVLPLIVVCRFCRTEAAPGERRCARCGMRLPVSGSVEAAPSPVVRFCSCGTPITRSICPACGARNATA
jgi:hypothetical protein